MNYSLFTIPQFLELHPMGRSTFYRLVNAGQLQIVKLGRATRIRREDAERWAASLPTKSGSGTDA